MIASRRGFLATVAGALAPKPKVATPSNSITLGPIGYRAWQEAHLRMTAAAMAVPYTALARSLNDPMFEPRRLSRLVHTRLIS